MATALNQKYAYLKDKLKIIGENAKILDGKDGMIELDPTNHYHREWFEDGEREGE